MRLFLVYNANSGWFNGLMDSAHKLFKPETYPCHLCELTHGYLTMNSSWKAFQSTTDFEVVYLHKDDRKMYPQINSFELPVIWIEKDDNWTEIVSAQQLEKLNSVDELIIFVKKLI